MSTKQELKRIKAELSAIPGGKRRRLTPELRKLIGQYARGRVDAGASKGMVASEVGIGQRTLTHALNAESKKTCVPVRVTARSGASLRVQGPGGWVIDGLDVESLAALLRVLS